MQIKTVLTALLGMAVLSDALRVNPGSPYARALSRRENGNGNGIFNRKNRNGNNGGNGGNGGNGNNGGSGSLSLDQNLVQTGSQQTGNNPGTDGQSASATDKANFINFCSGQTLTNGGQVRTGSCNGIPMGNIPSVDKMVASVFVNPKDGDNLQANQNFTIQVQMLNFSPGTFTNATSTYYSAPQAVDSSGQIIGHTHVTVQDTGSTLNPSTPLDPQQFAFFKGINDAGNGQGLLSAAVDGGLPAGNYRVCSMSSAANHQPVLMPVAQRGAQDDCVRFTVGGGGGGGGGNGNSGNNGKNGKNGQGGNTNNAANGNGQGQDGNANNGTASNNSGSNRKNRHGKSKGQDADEGNQTGSATPSSSSGSSKATALGGIAAPEVSSTGNKNRPFGVDGNSFTSKAFAVDRACDVQRKLCTEAAASGQLAGVNASDCDSQMTACVSQLSS